MGWEEHRAGTAVPPGSGGMASPVHGAYGVFRSKIIHCTEQQHMQNISPCLWFDGQAEEASAYYVSVFRNSEILSTAVFPDGTPGEPGKVMLVRFAIDGQEFSALNGGPHYSFTPAVSFVVRCESQEEMDRLWEKLSDGGEEQLGGWLVDRYGVSWQIIPSALETFLSSADAEASKRIMSAILQMRKLDISVIQRAFNNG